MSEQRPPEDDDRIILTDREWWKRATPKGDLYALVKGKIVGAGVELTYHGHEPNAPISGTATFKSLEVARHILTIRGFRRVDRL